MNFMLIEQLSCRRISEGKRELPIAGKNKIVNVHLTPISKSLPNFSMFKLKKLFTK